MALGMMLPLALVACNRSETANNSASSANITTSTTANAAAPAPAANASANSANSAAAAPATAAPAAGEVQATFKNFVRGDHLYAQFDLPAGREPEESAMLKDFEIAAFLNAHKGKPLFVVIRTKNEFLDPPGEKMDVTSLVSARSATQTSQQWLQSLTPQQRKAAIEEIASLPPEGSDS
jgi:hypothetical protein